MPNLSCNKRRTPPGFRRERQLTLLRGLRVANVDGVGAGGTSETVAAIVAELAANAVTHGRVPGRDFELRLSLPTGSVRIEVSDTRTGPRPPKPGDVRPPHPLDERGRGLVLVEALADRWEVLDRDPAPGKTVRVEVDVAGWRPVSGVIPADGGRRDPGDRR
ncbi:ATP-binding protein [Streptomyces sp. NPDC006356]